jgi:hypothetical protein
VLPERVRRVDHDAAIQRAGCLQHLGHDWARDGHENHFGARHGVGDRGRMCALAKFRCQRLRPGGVPGRKRDVVADGVPEPAHCRADAAGSEERNPHSPSHVVTTSSPLARFCHLAGNVQTG